MSPKHHATQPSTVNGRQERRERIPAQGEHCGWSAGERLGTVFGHLPIEKQRAYDQSQQGHHQHHREEVGAGF